MHQHIHGSLAILHCLITRYTLKYTLHVLNCGMNIEKVDNVENNKTNKEGKC